MLGSHSGVLGGQVQNAHAAAHGQRVVDVMAAGNAQTQMGEKVAPFQHVKLVEARLVHLDVDGGVIGLRIVDGEGAHRPVHAAHHVAGVGIVQVGDNGVLGEQGEATERELQLAQSTVIVQMVVVDVQNDGDGGGQLQERLRELAGFHHDLPASAGLSVAVDEG